MNEVCIPLRFGLNNHVPDSQLFSNYAPDMALDNMKHEHRARLTRWVNRSGEAVVIDGHLPELRRAEYFAIAGSNIPAAGEIRLELFKDVGRTIRVLDTGFKPLGTGLPLGEWRVGMDVFYAIDERTKPNTQVFWFPPVQIIYYRLHIRGHTDDLRVRMLLCGEKLQFQYNFAYGNEISLVTPPRLKYTASGTPVRIRPQRRRKALTLDMSRMSGLDYAKLARMETTLLGDPFLVAAFPEKTGIQFDNYSFLATNSTALRYKQLLHNMYQTTLNLIEV